MIDPRVAFLSYLIVTTMIGVLARNLFGLWRARQGHERRRRRLFRLAALGIACYAIWLYSDHIITGLAIPPLLGRPLVLGLSLVALLGSD